MSAESKACQLCPVMVTFADYGVEKLESNRTYELIITASGGSQVAQNNLGAIAQLVEQRTDIVYISPS